MTKNMGTADRTIRTLIALTIGGLYLAGAVEGTLGIVLLVVAGLFLATSAVGFCPAYVPLKISTRRRDASGPSGPAGPRA